MDPGLGSGEDDYLQGVDFLDVQHGWVAIREDFTQMTDPSYGRIDVWRTTDGGQHWTKTQLPKAVINQFGEILPPVQFDFLDTGDGFAFLSSNIAKGGNDSDLYWTADRGETWSADRPTGHSGVEGTVAFATANDGVVVNPPRGSGIAVTHDGGRTWKDAAVSLPPELTGAQPYFGEPVFFDGRSGLISIDFQMDTTSVSRVYRTSDAGSSWASAATLPAGISAVSFLDQKHWIGSNGSKVVRTVNGGATWTQTASSTPATNLGTAQFVDDSMGWGLEGLTGGSLLFATTDGGVTWRTLAPGTATSGPSASVSPLGTAALLPSSTPTNLATCRVESLTITGVGPGETGVVNFGVAMTNTSSVACSLPGVPSSVELLRATGTPLQLTVDPALSNASARVVAAPALGITLYAVGSRSPSGLPHAMRLTLVLSFLITGAGFAVAVVAGRPLLSTFGSGYAAAGTAPLISLTPATLPGIIKVHFIQVYRIAGRIRTAAAIISAAALFELSAASIGARQGGLVGLSYWYLGAVLLEAGLMSPLVLRAAGFRQRPPVVAAV